MACWLGHWVAAIRLIATDYACPSGRGPAGSHELLVLGTRGLFQVSYVPSCIEPRRLPVRSQGCVIGVRSRLLRSLSPSLSMAVARPHRTVVAGQAQLTCEAIMNNGAVTRLHRLIAVIGASALVILLTGAAATPAGNHPTVAAMALSKHRVELPGVPFSGEVNLMGTASFSDSYAGQFMTPSGRLIVYLARSGSSVFASELHHLAQAAHNGPDNYTLMIVPHSWAQLVSVTSRITSDMRSLQAQGVELAQWGPDPQSNKVMITLESYSEQAVHTLLHRYGTQWISVSHAAERWVLTDPGGAAMPRLNGETRLTDTAPFFAGDIQWYGSQSSSRACTSSFNFVAKKSGNRFGLASGHCVSNAGGAAGTVVYTNTKSRQTVGRISVQYFPGSKIDVASVNTGGFSANVYGNGTTTYSVVGATFPDPVT